MGAGVVGTGAPNLAGRSGAELAIGGRVPVAAGAAGPQHRVLDRGGGGADLLAGHHRAVGGSLGVGVRLLDQRRDGVQLPAQIVALLVHALLEALPGRLGGPHHRAGLDAAEWGRRAGRGGGESGAPAVEAVARTSVLGGKSVSVRVGPWGRRL